MKPQAGVSRTSLNPFWGVELTGWGYYLNRTWRDVRDSLHATALVIENGNSQLAVVSTDLMVISREFTQTVREMVQEVTGIPPDSILVSCTHTHNAPASGGLLGVGEVDPFYEEWAARQTATAIIQAWQERQPARFSAATEIVPDLTFNRTRTDGPVDPHLTTLLVEAENGSPIAALVGFQAHPTVSTVLHPRSVSRDVTGELCDHIEHALPGCLALYLQGACGDVNFHRSFSTDESASMPAKILSERLLSSLESRSQLDASQIGSLVRQVELPTRRWTDEEIQADRTEAKMRLDNHDLSGWRDTIGRVMTNRPDDMVSRHGGEEWKAVEAMCRFNVTWTDIMLQDLHTRPETLSTEIQALQIGDFAMVSNASEFFTTLALAVREQIDLPHIMFACYSNERIGYLPDAHDVDLKSYAAYQSPKYCNQFPFTEQSGSVMVTEMVSLANELVR